MPLARAGDREATAALVASVTPFVIQQAAKYSEFTHLDTDDLIQAGLVGVVRAIDSHKPGGAPWKVYAMRSGVNEIARLIDREDRYQRRFAVPTTAPCTNRSLDIRGAEGDGGTYTIDPPAPVPGPLHPERTSQGWDVVRVRNALSRLDPVSAELVRLVHGIDRETKKPNDAAKTIGVGGWAAKRLLRQALATLRDHLR